MRRPPLTALTTPAENSPDAGLPRIAVGVDEIAKALGISTSQVELMTRRGELPVFRAGRRLLFPIRAIEEYMCAKAMESLAAPGAESQEGGAE